MACPTQALLSLGKATASGFQVCDHHAGGLLGRPASTGTYIHSSSGKHFKIYSGTLHQIPSVLSPYLGSGRHGKNMKRGLAPRCHTATLGDTVLMLPYTEASKVFVSLLSGYYRPAHAKISPLRSGGSATSATTLPVIGRH